MKTYMNFRIKAFMQPNGAWTAKIVARNGELYEIRETRETKGRAEFAAQVMIEQELAQAAA